MVNYYRVLSLQNGMTNLLVCDDLDFYQIDHNDTEQLKLFLDYSISNPNIALFVQCKEGEKTYSLYGYKVRIDSIDSRVKTTFRRFDKNLNPITTKEDIEENIKQLKDSLGIKKSLLHNVSQLTPKLESLIENCTEVMNDFIRYLEEENIDYSIIALGDKTDDFHNTNLFLTEIDAFAVKIESNDIDMDHIQELFNRLKSSGGNAYE